MKRKLFKIMAVVMVAVFGVAGVCLAEIKPWAPYRGTSEVNQLCYNQTFQFSWTSLQKFTYKNSYEHEVQIYNANFADYNNYWTSTMPNAYRDTQDCDGFLHGDKNIDNLAIGTYTATWLKPEKVYRTYMSLRKTTSNSVENEKIKANSTVWIKGQIGILKAPGYYFAWNVYPVDTTYKPGLYYNASAAHKPMCWQYK